MPITHPAYFNDCIWNHAALLCESIRKTFAHQDFSSNTDLQETIDSITYTLPATISKADTCDSIPDSCSYWMQSQTLLCGLSKLLNEMIDSGYLDMNSFSTISSSIQQLTSEIEITLSAKRKKSTQTPTE